MLTTPLPPASPSPCTGPLPGRHEEGDAVPALRKKVSGKSACAHHARQGHESHRRCEEQAEHGGSRGLHGSCRCFQTLQLAHLCDEEYRSGGTTASQANTALLTPPADARPSRAADALSPSTLPFSSHVLQTQTRWTDARRRGRQSARKGAQGSSSEQSPSGRGRSVHPPRVPHSTATRGHGTCQEERAH